MKDLIYWRELPGLGMLLDEFKNRYLNINLSQIESALDILIPAVLNGRVIYTAGNGGSDADAHHIVGELMKGFIKKRRYGKDFTAAATAVDPLIGKELVEKLQQGIPALSLSSQPALNSAFANDVDYNMSLAQVLASLGKAGDVLWCLSTSGMSQNILYAAVTAKAMGIKVLSMTGKDGGKLKEYSDCCITVPEEETYKVQEYHLPIYHCLCLCLEEYMFGEHAYNE